MKNFIAHTDDVRQEILKEISCTDVDGLFKHVPAKFKDFNIGNPLSEMAAQRQVKALARKNKTAAATQI